MQELIRLDNGQDLGELIYDEDNQAVYLHIKDKNRNNFKITFPFEEFDKLIYSYLVIKEKDLKNALSTINKLKKENREYEKLIRKGWGV